MSHQFKTLLKLKVRGRTVFDRVDFNVVIGGKIIDQFRIEAALPTIRYLLERDCAVVLASHNGRPKGHKDRDLSLEPVAPVLADLLGEPVHFIGDCVGDEVQRAAGKLQPGQILLLENLRFHKGEEANDRHFADQLAQIAEVYVDDAFAAVHRAHASVATLPDLLPHAAGLLVEREYDTLHGLLERPKRPFTAIIGGAKVSDKLDVLHSLINKVDNLAIGGAMANTFLYAQGYPMGRSVMEPKLKTDAHRLLSAAKKRGVRVLLPTDLLVAGSPAVRAKAKLVAASAVPTRSMALDIGPRSTAAIIELVHGSKTVFWNGTVGLAEVQQFAHGSYKIAHALAHTRAETIIGGGDTASFVDSHRLHDEYEFISTGGGASLDLLAGHDLPGIDALA